MYKNLWELADSHVTKILEIITVMGSRGIRVDLTRLKEFNVELDRQMDTLQKVFNERPDLSALGGHHPKNGYVRAPKTTEGLCEIDVPPGAKGYTLGARRWAKLKAFKATSSKQVLAYIRSKGHTVAKTKEGDDTSGAKALLMAWRKYKDDNYRDIVQFRKLKKLRGTYGEWPLRPVDENYSEAVTKFTLKPTTNRLSSVAPNVQNIPKDGPLPEKFRSCLVARPGHKLLRVDLASAEALITGWLAKDPTYMRLATLGTHKYAMAVYLGLLEHPIALTKSDDELRAALKPVKDLNETLYRQIKTVIYGGNYLAGPKKIFENNPEEFTSQGEAKKFLTFCQSLSPKIKVWQQATIRQAQSTKKLRNPFGYECDFWDLPGGDGPACVAYGPQSIVAAVIKEIMVQLWPTLAGQFMIWQIHDELVFDVPSELVDEVRQIVTPVVTQSWPQLGGLSFGCEIKVSEDMR